MRLTRIILGLAVVVAFLTVSAALALDAGDRAPAFDLKDQFGKNWKLSDMKNKVVVVVAATQHSGRDMGPWFDKLKQKYGARIQLLGFLDLHDIFVLGRGIAKSRIRKETDDPMMLDFKGDMGKAFNVTDKYPVVVVIDKKGFAMSVQKTKYTDQAYKSVTEAIDAATRTE